MGSKSNLAAIGPKVLIVGAGIAGLSAASRLLEKGFSDVTILEAQDRIGGRMYTKQLGKAVIELGAQWIHGEENNPIYNMAKENHLLPEIEEPLTMIDAEFRTQEGELLNKHLGRDFEIIMASISEECRETVNAPLSTSPQSKTDRSVLVFFQRRFTEYLKATSDLPRSSIIKEALFRWYCLFRNTVEGCDSLAEMSTKSWGDYKECPGNQVIDLKNGYRDILDVIKTGISTDKIILNKPVRAVHIAKPIEGKLPEGKLPVNVICQDGESIQCHHVILTCSLGYLKRYCNSMFMPPIPDAKRQAITQLGYGTVNKIFLEFEKPFWPPDSAGYSFLWVDDPAADVKGASAVKQTMADIWFKAIMGFYTVYNQPTFLCGWIAGKEARYMETLDDNEVIDVSIKLLKQFTRQETLPEVLRIVRSAWHTNPYALGSYSYKTWQCDGIADVIGDLIKPLKVMLDDKSVGGLRTHPAVLFAGEATHPEYFSTVHGAYLSGLREAEFLDNYYRALHEEMEKESQLYEKYKDLTSSHRIIIVGAGIAGLTAAEKLIEDKIPDIKVLEARSTAGGRLCSIVHDDKFLELGAQWIHGERGNEVFSYAQKHYLLDVGNLPSPEAEGLFVTSEKTCIDPELVIEIKQFFMKSFEACAKFAERGNKLYLPSSVGDFLNQRFQKYIENFNYSPETIKLKTALYNWFLCYCCIDNACDSMEDLSAKCWGEYIDCPGNPRINFKNGYKSIVEKLIEHLPSDAIEYNCPVQTIFWDRSSLTVNLIRSFDPAPLPSLSTSSVQSAPTKKKGKKLIKESPVTEIDFSQDDNENRKILGLKRSARHPDTYPIEILCENGRRYLCEHVIVTVSLGCLKSNLNLFSPSLPEVKQHAIRTSGFGTINKIFLIFEKPFWPEDCHGIQLIWMDEDHSRSIFSEENNSSAGKPWYYDISGFDVVHGHTNVLLGWIGRQGAIEMENLTDSEITNRCMDLIKYFTGFSNVTEPIMMYRSKWHSDPYILGSYSYRSVSSEKEEITVEDLENPIVLQVEDLKYPAILFAGEATDKAYYATVHGAMSSGYRESGRITDFYATLRQKTLAEHEKLLKMWTSTNETVETKEIKSTPSKGKDKTKTVTAKDKGK